MNRPRFSTLERTYKGLKWNMNHARDNYYTVENETIYSIPHIYLAYLF